MIHKFTCQIRSELELKQTDCWILLKTKLNDFNFKTITLQNNCVGNIKNLFLRLLVEFQFDKSTFTI